MRYIHSTHLNTLYLDSAISREDFGISMALLIVGTTSEKGSETLAYAHGTQHGMIIRYWWLLMSEI